MKSCYVYIILLPLFMANAAGSFAQTTGIISGKIYTLESKSSSKLLDIRNASMENSANADCRTDTHSDAQRWIVTPINKDVYTLTNVASGKLLHIASDAADSVQVDQYFNTGNNDVKWIIREAGNGSCYLKPAADTSFSLSLSAGDTSDGANVFFIRIQCRSCTKMVLSAGSPTRRSSHFSHSR